MATAGELVIKIAADYAQLVTGMNEAGAKIDGFGKKIEAQTSAMTRGFGALATAAKGFVAGLAVQQLIAFGEAIEKTVGDMADMAENLKLSADAFQAFQGAAYLAGQSTEAVSTAIGKFNVFIGKASEGSKEQIERLNQLGVKILDVNGALRPQAELLQEVATGIANISDPAKRAAAEVAIFGKSGQAVSAILEQWAKGTDALNRELEAQGLRHLPETIKKMDELADTSAKAAKKIEVFFAPFYASAKATVLDTMALAFERISKAINSIDVVSLDSLKALALLVINPGAAVAGAADLLSSTGAADKVQAEITRLDAQIEAAGARLAKMREDGTAATQSYWIQSKQLEKLEADRQAAIARLQKVTGPMGPFTAPEITVTGDRNPGVKGAGDAIQEALNKLAAEEIAARNAFTRFQENTAGNFEAQKRAIELERDIQTKIADLQAKADTAGVGAGFRESIERQVRATAEAQAALKLYEADAAKADATTRQLGDGSEELARVLEDLDRQLKTGRLSQVAYARAVEQANDRQRDQADELARYTGGLEAFSAGIDKAARDYEKANDAFSMGGRAFGGFINAIDQSLDVLAGTSNKTFEQIASDFGRMIAKMALQAALSPVFKWIMGGLTGSVGGIGGDASGPDGGVPASGGGIFSWLGGLFGGGRAIGGTVQPGMTYDVGEHGPEKFTPMGAGTITPYRASDSGGVTVNLDMGRTEGARDPTAALEFGRKIKVAVTDIIMNEKRPGGLLYGG